LVLPRSCLTTPFYPFVRVGTHPPRRSLVFSPFLFADSFLSPSGLFVLLLASVQPHSFCPASAHSVLTPHPLHNFFPPSLDSLLSSVVRLDRPSNISPPTSAPPPTPFPLAFALQKRTPSPCDRMQLPLPRILFSTKCAQSYLASWSPPIPCRDFPDTAFGSLVCTPPSPRCISPFLCHA